MIRSRIVVLDLYANMLTVIGVFNIHLHEKGLSIITTKL